LGYGDTFGDALEESASTLRAGKPSYELEIFPVISFGNTGADPLIEIDQALDTIVRLHMTRIIVIAALPAQSRQVLQVAAQKGLIGSFIFVAPEWALPEVWNVADPTESNAIKSYMNGIVGVAPHKVTTPRRTQVEMKCAQIEPYCSTPDPYMIYAYDATYILAYAFDRIIRDSSLELNGSTVVNQIRLHTYNGASGNITLDQNGDPASFFDVINVVDAQFHVVGSYDATIQMNGASITWPSSFLGYDHIHIPDDQVPNRLVTVGDSAKHAIYSLMSICIAFAWILHALLFINREHKVTNTIQTQSHLQPLFSALILNKIGD
jgi:hypothetical protein